MSKPKKEKRKQKKRSDTAPRPVKPPTSASTKLSTVTKKINTPEGSMRETTTSTSKAGIKLTLVNKTKVPSKKRVLDSPPPEELPPSKRANLPMPEKVERPKTVIIKPGAVAAAKAKAQAPKPVAAPVAKAATKPSSKPAAKPSKPSATTLAKKSQPNRREELLKQLRAVEDAIAKKRSKT